MTNHCTDCDKEIGHHDLLVINISAPSNPFEVNYWEMAGDVNGVAVAGEHIYLSACLNPDDGDGSLVILRLDRQ